MSEEQTQVSVAAVEGSDGSPSQEASEHGDGQKAEAAVSTEMQTLIEAEVAKVRESVVKEYEGPGGKIAQVQSKLHKQAAEAERRLHAMQLAKLQEVEELVERDPTRGAQLAVEQARAVLEQQSVASQESQIESWVEKQYEAYAANLEDDEVAGMAAQDYEKLLDAARSNPDGGQAAAAEFQQKLGQRMVAAEREKSAGVSAELAELKAAMPGMIETTARRVLEAGAGGVDLSTPGKTPSREEEPDQSAGALKKRGMELIQAQKEALKPNP